MYHSHLLINVGVDPDRPDWSVARRWLRNLYRVHQRLSMAFPSAAPATAVDRIAAYCRPFEATLFAESRPLPDESASDDVRQPRSPSSGFLFRIDHPVDRHPGVRRPVILVQSESAREPDWDYAFGLNDGAVDERGRPIGNAGFLLAAPVQRRRISIDLDGEALVLTGERQNCRLTPGDVLRFRLLANPVCTTNGRRHRPRIDEQSFKAHVDVRRQAFQSVHLDWLRRKLGTAVERIDVATFVTGWAHGWRTKYEPQPSQRMQWWSALFEGTCRLQDPAALHTLLVSGVGPAKAFGFGLLSVAPLHPKDH